MRSITANYSGECRDCGESFPAGEPIFWGRGEGAIHTDCATTEHTPDLPPLYYAATVSDQKSAAVTETPGALLVSNPGPDRDNNNWVPSFGHRKIDLAAEVKRALRRRTDAEVCQSWGGLRNWKELKFGKPTTLRAIKAELKRQAARIGKPDGTAISAAGRVRDPVWEHETYTLWMGGMAA